jgi:hypothetical protein
MKDQKNKLFILIGGGIVFLIGIAYLALFLNGKNFQEKANTTPQANITVLPAMVIPTMDNSFLYIIPTSTATPGPEGSGKYLIGSYVQIFGTGGNGLKIRDNPGTSSNVNFIAAESEVFKVIGGPIQSGDYEWWQLVAPYDQSRQGWAAGEYISEINP